MKGCHPEEMMPIRFLVVKSGESRSAIGWREITERERFLFITEPRARAGSPREAR
jgi:hypothetical protein